MTRISNWTVLVCMGFATGCTDVQNGDVTDGSDSDLKPAVVEQEIRGGIEQGSSLTDVYINLWGRQCTGALIAKNAILTAAHCAPFDVGERNDISDYVTFAKIARKKTTGKWECLSNLNGAVEEGTTSQNACANWGYAQIYWNTDYAYPDAGHDVAIVKPYWGTGVSSAKFVSTNLHTRIYTGSIPISPPQIGYGIGYSTYSGNGFGELRAGIFTPVPLFTSATQYSVSTTSTYQVCHGDSGGAAGYWLTGDPDSLGGVAFGVAGVLSKMYDTNGECASPGGTEQWARVLADVSWIQGILGKTCKSVTLKDSNGASRSVRNCW